MSDKRNNLSRKVIYAWIRKKRNDYHKEALRHPSTAKAYHENIDRAYTLQLLLNDFEALENGSYEETKDL